MRRFHLQIAVVLTSLLLAAGPVLAGNGVGPGNGTGPIHSFEPFEYAGVVDEYLDGQGVAVCEAEGECITVYGIGPQSYWEEVDVARPAVGEVVTVTYIIETFDDEARNIATEIAVGDEIVYLRDDDGTPLWR